MSPLVHSVKKAKPKEIPRSYFDNVEGDHGRIEIRRHWVISDIDWIEDKPLWKGLQGIGMVERERHIKDHISCETSYYLLSQKLDAEAFAEKVRAHWGIENKLHWVLDVSFREDECRKRVGNAAENFAIVRHIAMKSSMKKKSMNVKRLQAG